jgi:hypothetical protein
MKRPEPEPSKLREQTQAYTTAYDERTRLFTALRDPYLTDDERQTTLADYSRAAVDFDKLRKDILSK